MPWKSLAIAVGCLFAAWIAVMLVFRAASRTPTLGVRDGRLIPCPGTPNCVCSQDPDERFRLEPLTYTGPPAAAFARLQAVVAAQPRTRIVTSTETYLHAEFRTLLFRFVDDVEFLLDAEAGCIHFRSASRAGRSDLGVNRQRMESIRTAFAARQE